MSKDTIYINASPEEVEKLQIQALELLRTLEQAKMLEKQLAPKLQALSIEVSLESPFELTQSISQKREGSKVESHTPTPRFKPFSVISAIVSILALITSLVALLVK